MMEIYRGDNEDFQFPEYEAVATACVRTIFNNHTAPAPLMDVMNTENDSFAYLNRYLNDT